MKGFKDSDGKFHPITQSKRKSREEPFEVKKIAGVPLKRLVQMARADVGRRRMDDPRTTQMNSIDDLPIKKSVFISSRKDYNDFRDLVLGGWFLPLYKQFSVEERNTVERLARKYNFRPVPISFLEDFERVEDGKFVYGARVYFRGSGEGMDIDKGWHERNKNDLQRESRDESFSEMQKKLDTPKRLKFLKNNDITDRVFVKDDKTGKVIEVSPPYGSQFERALKDPNWKRKMDELFEKRRKNWRPQGYV